MRSVRERPPKTMHVSCCVHIEGLILLWFTSTWFRVVATLQEQRFRGPTSRNYDVMHTFHRMWPPVTSFWLCVRAGAERNQDLDRLRRCQKTWTSWCWSKVGHLIDPIPNAVAISLARGYCFPPPEVVAGPLG